MPCPELASCVTLCHSQIIILSVSNGRDRIWVSVVVAVANGSVVGLIGFMQCAGVNVEHEMGRLKALSIIWVSVCISVPHPLVQQ